MKTKAILLISIITLSLSCKSIKNNETSKTNDTYRVIVTFASKGEGVSIKDIASLESFILSFGKSEDKTIAYDKINWGNST